MYSRILIPLDGSKTAEKVLPYARSLASKLKIPVELIGVIDVTEMATHLSTEKARYLDNFLADGERASKEYLEQIAGSFPGVTVSYTVKRGAPDDMIVKEAAKDNTTLLAMATHGRSGVTRWLLGSVAEKVLRQTANPLILVRAHAEAKTEGEAPLKSVLVPLDGSQLAESALPKALELAKVLKLEFILFHAFELQAGTYYGSEEYLPNYAGLKNKVRDKASAYLERKIEEIKAEGIEKTSTVLMEGAGADEIISYARKNPDILIAMSTHGRSGVRRWMLGSVTEKVVRHSGDPVLVVRGK